MMTNPLFKLAMGALWTAGHRPGNKAVLHLAFRFAGKTPALAKLERDDQIRSVLGAEYDLDPAGSGLRIVTLLKDRDGPRGDDARPMAGHLVETGDLWLVPEVRLEGYHGTDEVSYSLGNRVGFWTGQPKARGMFTLSGGGPASIIKVSTANLVSTGRTAWLSQSDYPGLPQANGKVDWLVEVPIWQARTLEWDGYQQSKILTA